ncbi:MAG: hypothetical protein IJ422_03910 [Oscillospiraceae bacterium]|nr:hypothetical protein [Oscillospiraceae bacterium]
MMGPITILNKTMELADCRDQWYYDEKHGCWCLEDILYTPAATTPKFQQLSIFVPKALLNADGSFPEEAKKVPVVFENNSAGYMQMPHVWLGGPRCYAEQYLEHGLIYVSCGCRGRESRDANGRLIKGPCTLVDLKTAIRFLRHNREVLPGDWDRIISTGWSAGGAMSSLLAVTGDNENYLPYLEENGAFLEESDAIYAAQIYCPIIDLEHADLAYEWMFCADKENEDSPAGPAWFMTPFKNALSAVLVRRYVEYFNALKLRHPETNELLQLNEDGRSGNAYDYLMERLNDSATDYFVRLEAGKLSQKYSVADYLNGNYMTLAPAPMEAKPERDPGMHHAGPGMQLPSMGEKPPAPPSLGDLLSRPPKGVPFVDMAPKFIEVPGSVKPWLTWDGERACISDLDTYVLNHRRRIKPCTSFDKLEMDSGENQAFGTPERDFVHYVADIADAIAELKDAYPAEYAKYYEAYASVASDAALAERVRLLNPLCFIGAEEKSAQAKHYRIRVGACDADTSLSVSMTLALKLQNADCGTVDYALVWDQPHSEADYPGDVLAWIDAICQ